MLGRLLDEIENIVHRYIMLSGVLIYFRVPSISLTIAALVSVLALTAGTLDVGLTENGTVIEAVEVPAPSASLPTVLLLGGLANADESVDIIKQELKTFG